MKLNAAQLDGFFHVAQTLNFTKAAELLHVTQSALSQRISKLEDDLETTLFIRDRGAIKLTEMGFRLLRYCKIQEGAETELLSALKSSKKGLGGILRIGGFSSVNRSLVIPALRTLLIQNASLSIQLMAKEIRELDDLLKRAEVDYILTNREPLTADVESVVLGYEENVLVGAKKYPAGNIYLDHDEEDETTHAYFKLHQQPYKPKLVRYLDDVYGLIEGVKNGYGLAVLPRHLVEGEDDLKVIDGKKILRVPIYLHFYRQPYYRPGHEPIITALCAYFRQNL